MLPFIGVIREAFTAPSPAHPSYRMASIHPPDPEGPEKCSRGLVPFFPRHGASRVARAYPLTQPSHGAIISASQREEGRRDPHVSLPLHPRHPHPSHRARCDTRSVPKFESPRLYIQRTASRYIHATSCCTTAPPWNPGTPPPVTDPSFNKVDSPHAGGKKGHTWDTNIGKLSHLAAASYQIY